MEVAILSPPSRRSVSEVIYGLPVDYLRDREPKSFRGPLPHFVKKRIIQCFHPNRVADGTNLINPGEELLIGVASILREISVKKRGNIPKLDMNRRVERISASELIPKGGIYRCACYALQNVLLHIQSEFANRREMTSLNLAMPRNGV